MRWFFILTLIFNFFAGLGVIFFSSIKWIALFSLLGMLVSVIGVLTSGEKE